MAYHTADHVRNFHRNSFGNAIDPRIVIFSNVFLDPDHPCSVDKYGDYVCVASHLYDKKSRDTPEFSDTYSTCARFLGGL
ncbi:MAG: hypothetical protein EOP45_10590 [Sphingobacteriaceae bacterium]|nr:MAG: hypothetical protein EOP45_10590 [Sphingobacteriaceae bacterium]